jgi:D-glycero-D-manno-heptose 1,7-bisphosphate phosphatase
VPTKVAVFLDRDGVINEDKDYVYKIEDFKFIIGSQYAIRKLNNLGCTIIVVTNQSGIERGYYTKDDVIKLHNHMLNSLFKINTKIDGIYFSPDMDPSSEYRKPNPGMFLKAIKDHKLENHKKYVVGDKLSDLIAGDHVGCKKILVKTGKGLEELKKIKTLKETPDFVATNLFRAVDDYIRFDMNL